MDLTRRLIHVDCLNKITMEKGVFGIKLMDGPVFGNSNAKNGVDSCKFDYGTERFIKV